MSDASSSMKTDASSGYGDPAYGEILSKLQAENEELRRRLEEAEETIDAIRNGAVDALVVQDKAGHRVYTLEGAERPYRAFVEEMQQGAATLHPDGTIAWCNAQFSNLLAASQEKLVGAKFLEFVAADSLPVYEDLLWQGQTQSGRAEAQLQRVDGRTIPAFLTFNALPKDCGAAIGVLVTDLTTQKHHEQLSAAHEALSRAERELRDFLENASLGLHWVGPDGIIVWANKTELDLLGYTREEYVGHHISEFHASAPVIEDMLTCLTRGETLHAYQAQLLCKDGSIRYVAIDSNVLFENGKFIHTRCFTRDITTEKMAVEALRESEERFRKMADAVPVLVWVSDMSKGCNWFNQCWRDFSGRPLEELLGDGWTQDVHPDDLKRCLEIYNTNFDARQPFSMEYRLKRHDGEYRWVLDNGIPRFEANGVFAGYIGACSDFTERKQADDALRRSEERYRLLVSVVTDVPWTADASGAFVTAQPAWANYTGQSWEEYQGFGWINAIHPEDRRRVKEAWLQACEQRVLYQSEGRFWHALSGQWRHFSAKATPLLNPYVGAGEWVGTYTDIDDQKMTEEKLEQAVAERTAQLQETIGELEAFSYSISHDMRSPLRAMQGYADALLEKYQTKLDNTGAHYLDRIHRGAARLDLLISDVLAYSKVAKGDVHLNEVDFEAIIADVVQGYPQFQEPAAEIRLLAPLPRVMGHEAYLTQIASNLIGNAVKFIPHGVKPEITISAVTRGEMVQFWFEDNGIGIDPRHHVEIFQIFGRVYSEKQFKGTGIGLAIVKKAAERMGGSVGVESELGKGSRFWVRLKKKL